MFPFFEAEQYRVKAHQPLNAHLNAAHSMQHIRLTQKACYHLFCVHGAAAAGMTDLYLHAVE
jgi:hypothetical protein